MCNELGRLAQGWKGLKGRDRVMCPIVLNNSKSKLCHQQQHTRGCVNATKVRKQVTYAAAVMQGVARTIHLM